MKVILDYPKIGGDDIEDYAKKAIRNILHENIDVHSRTLSKAKAYRGYIFKHEFETMNFF